MPTDKAVSDAYMVEQQAKFIEAFRERIARFEGIKDHRETIANSRDYIAKLEMEAEQNSVLIVALQDTIKAIDAKEVPEGWSVEKNPKAVSGFDWDYYHDDWEDGLCGTAATREHAIQYILEGSWDL